MIGKFHLQYLFTRFYKIQLITQDNLQMIYDINRTIRDVHDVSDDGQITVTEPSNDQ